jgi:hypothetical protein
MNINKEHFILYNKYLLSINSNNKGNFKAILIILSLKNS